MGQAAEGRVTIRSPSMNFYDLEASKPFYLMILGRRGVGLGGDALSYLNLFLSVCILQAM